MHFLKRQSEKIGLAPGSYIFLGEKKQEKLLLNLMNFDAENFEFGEIADFEDSIAYKNKKSTTWINIYGLHEVDVLQKIEKLYDIHPLVMEDILNTSQRPKIEFYDNYIFAVIKMIYYDTESSEMTVEQISLIIFDNMIICLQERKGDFFNVLRERIKNGKGRVRKSGADYLAYAILDVIIDNYFLVLEKLGDQIEDLDDEVTEHPSPDIAHRINALKRILILLRKNTWPLREVINMLTRSEVPFFKKSTQPFLRDLYDHTIQVLDTAESYREMINGLMDLYMSHMSNRMNEVMKVLTIIATIFIPLSFLAGVYGMNFDTSSAFNMPELSYKYGYFLFWSLVVLVGGGLLLFFKRKKWL